MPVARIITAVDRRIFARRLSREFHGAFDRYRAIFVHIPKAAGSSVALSMFGHQVSHTPIVEHYRRNYRKTQDYFKFTFVRDPLARLYSAFRFLKHGGMNAQDRRFASKNMLEDDFNTFVARLDRDATLRCSLHFRPQYTFVTAPDNPRLILVNFIGKSENINEDYRRVASQLGISSGIAHLNRQPETTPLNEIVSDQTRAIVQDIYALDYELFGYLLD